MGATLLVKEEVRRESGGTGFRRTSNHCAFSCLECAPVAFAAEVCQVCDSPLVEMLDEAENSEASTIECSEDEEWGLKTLVGLWCHVGSVLDLADECGDCHDLGKLFPVVALAADSFEWMESEDVMLATVGLDMTHAVAE